MRTSGVWRYMWEARCSGSNHLAELVDGIRSVVHLEPQLIQPWKPAVDDERSVDLVGLSGSSSASSSASLFETSEEEEVCPIDDLPSPACRTRSTVQAPTAETLVHARAEAPRADVVPRGPDRSTRNFYIRRRVELAKCGFTANCPACLAASSGLPGAGLRHTSVCRARIQALLTH